MVQLRFCKLWMTTMEDKIHWWFIGIKKVKCLASYIYLVGPNLAYFYDMNWVCLVNVVLASRMHFGYTGIDITYNVLNPELAQ